MPVGIVAFWIVLIGLWPSPKASDLMPTVDRAAGTLRAASHDRDFLIARLRVLSAIYTNIRQPTPMATEF
ncbi:hypothetical protein K1W69_13980 [Hoeflea sp. WL0058]|uniref:Uncharacterized protein n=1 Tax=Flavimaribacter sediminis TaxID=2865987 RepID=A0AAE3D0A2_9HYPH|nr:hypothetical protein [Flavimaribacter sediminis]MBW8638300.1 hypothetical protein [Flavimaribacter sediminis]